MSELADESLVRPAHDFKCDPLPPTVSDEKSCSKCKAIKPRSEFYTDARRLDGLRGWCKACHRVSTAAESKRRTPAQRAAMKRKYGGVSADIPYVPLAERRNIAFAKEEGERDRVKARNIARAAWKEWLEVRAPRWWLVAHFANSVSKGTRKGTKLWTARASDAEIEAWRAEEREAYRVRYEADPEKERERAIAYKNANPDKVAAWQGVRVEQMLATSDGTLTASVIRRLLSDAKVCPYDGLWLIGRTKALDHIEPLRRGGTHTLNNVVVCCQKCNNRKSARPFVKWLSMLDDENVERAVALYQSRFGFDPRRVDLGVAVQRYADAAWHLHALGP